MPDENQDQEKPDVAEIGFGIRGDDFDPEEASRLLGLVPSVSYRRDEEYLTKTGRTLRRPWNLWQYKEQSTGEEIDLTPLLESVLQKLRGKIDVIEGFKSRTGLRVSVFIYWQPSGGSGGYTLPCELLSELTALGTEVDFYYA